MLDQVLQLLKQKNIHSYSNEGILILPVTSSHEGILLAKELFYTLSDRKTVFYLSGGSTPKRLYEMLGKEEKMLPGAVGMIDERFGKKWHEKSNEMMMRESGLLRYLQMRDVPFYPMITDTDREVSADNYDKTFRELQQLYQKHIALLGVGTDAHIASIIPTRPDFENPLFTKNDYAVVSSFNDTIGLYKERITVTFNALSLMDMSMVLVFGEEKKKALDALFSEGKVEDVPARFLKQRGVSEKTIIITDQVIPL